MNYKAAYERWLSEPTVDAETKAELAAIAENDEEKFITLKNGKKYRYFE